MKRLFIWALSLLLAAAPVSAQMMSTGIGGGGFGGAAGASFSGPCDAVSGAKVFLGFVSCSAAYASALSPAADICDEAARTTCTTINFLATGYWDAATAAASASCATACVVSKFYDSSGNGNDAPVDAGHYGKITFNSLGSCSAIGNSTVIGTTSPGYKTAAITTINQPWSMAGIVKRVTNTTNERYLIGSSSGGGAALGFSNTPGLGNFYASAPVTQTATDNAWHALIGIGNGASGSMSVDGSTQGGNAGTQTISNIYFATDAFGSNLNGSQGVAAGIWPSSVSVSTLNANLHSLCGGF
jgi:hypothetical protein